ncbi:MAG TPA: HEAT repeat domain-containing protein [Bryobacteraceae bacterium]|nr:HEAT repeat domain-containing protein [Bryobacteraceae bacterium]
METTGANVNPAQQPQTPAAKAEPVKPPKAVPPPEFQSESIDKLTPADLVNVLKNPSATTFQKAKACQRLASVGTKEAVPALTALLAHPQLSVYARYSLEPIADPSADEALRSALPRVTGKLRVGVINSIGHRGDAAAVSALSRLLYAPDTEAAQAAAAALGKISGVPAANALRTALASTKDPVRKAVAAAGLVCAEGLLAQGSRAEALSLYDTLTRTTIPKPVRLAAMHGVIAAETSLARPRQAPAK